MWELTANSGNIVPRRFLALDLVPESTATSNGANGLGECRSCPEDKQGNPYPLGCFFNVEDRGQAIGQQAVESCAATCASSLRFSDCKLCPENINGFDFVVNPEEEECTFCPNDIVVYPQNEFRLFGEGIKCWQVQTFFDSVQVHPDSPNCRLAQMMNYICGCDGPGYGGASTETKKAVLAWLPRAMAILSILVSAVACQYLLCCSLAKLLVILPSLYYRDHLLFFTIP